MADEGRSITVTIKYGRGHDDSWTVFRGSPTEVREDIAAFFSLDGKSVAELSLHELVVEAGQIAQSTTTVVKGLNARIVPQPASEPTAAWKAAEAAPSPAQSTAGAVLEQIAACKNTDELRRLWATNQTAFGDQAVMDAWKARGRALKGS
ncbi:hypothetical protein ACIRPS_17930 [Streptomyces griseoviridis]